MVLIVLPVDWSLFFGFFGMVKPVAGIRAPKGLGEHLPSTDTYLKGEAVKQQPEWVGSIMRRIGD